METSKNILTKAEEFVSALFNEKLPPKLVYHDYLHTLETVEGAKEIGEKSGLNEVDLEIVQLAAWLHDTGYTETYVGHEAKSVDIAEAFLKKNGYPEDKSVLV